MRTGDAFGVKADADGSGALDKVEVGRLSKELGINLTGKPPAERASE